MGLFASMNVAHTGMSAAETNISVIGNNLSNANTTGFKSQRADFSTIYARYYSLGSSPEMTQYSAGSNPIQIGQGVLTTGTTTDFSQGAIQPGMTGTDMAINGDGFFIVRPSMPGTQQQFYTRDGTFKLNSNQQLVTQTGEYVMGYTVNDEFEIQTDELSPLTIAVGKTKIAEATENVSIEGLLNAVGDSATQGTALESVGLTDLSWSSPGSETVEVSQAARPSVETAGTTATENAGGGAVEAGKYYYRFVYTRSGDMADQTDYSTQIWVEATADDAAVTIDNLPLGQLPNANPPYTHIAIYRATEPESETFYKVDELPVGSAGTSYTDTKSNAEIAANPQLDLSRLEGAYEYYVTFVDASGNESRPSYVSSTINVNSGAVTLSDIPTVDASDNPDGWVGRKIYRSVADGSGQYHLVETVNNLDPNVTITDSTGDRQLVNNEKMSFGGKGNVLANANTLMTNVGIHDESGRFVQLFAEGTLEFTPNKGGNDLNTGSMAITGTTTMNEYLKFVNDAMGIRNNPDIPKDQGAVGSQINGGTAGVTMIDGKVVVLGNTGVENRLNISGSDFKFISSDGKITPLNLKFNETQQCVGDGISTDLLVFDSLGAPVNVHLTLVLESKSNTETVYRWYADSGDNQPGNGSGIAVGTGTMRFDSDGKLIDVDDATITIERTDVASHSPLSFSFAMDLSAVAALATSNQNLSMIDQDGAGAGVLYDYTIDDNGVIIGTFTSGVTRPLGQVLLAHFVNNEGLVQKGENLFSVGPNSGQAVIGVPGQGVYGSIKGRSLEMSNTDIGNELIEMIGASSMYRANSKIVTTANEMLAALLNMV